MRITHSTWIVVLSHSSGLDARDARTSAARLTVRNIPGKGCVFTVDIPTAAPPALQPEAEA
jgi:hypothetical protein